MKKKIKYTDEPLGRLKIVDDFLPPPSELIFKEDTVKVTIGLSRSSIEFFKQEAKNHHTQYQKMIRNLLDLYAAHHRDQALKSGSRGGRKHSAV
ncbi:MAG: CopG family transcriptional regulator [Nitrospiria bacterium]